MVPREGPRPQVGGEVAAHRVAGALEEGRLVRLNFMCRRRGHWLCRNIRPGHPCSRAPGPASGSAAGTQPRKTETSVVGNGGQSRRGWRGPETLRFHAPPSKAAGRATELSVRSPLEQPPLRYRPLEPYSSPPIDSPISSVPTPHLPSPPPSFSEQPLLLPTCLSPLCPPLLHSRFQAELMAPHTPALGWAGAPPHWPELSVCSVGSACN